MLPFILLTPFSIAEAMVIKDGKIVETGTTTELQNKYDVKEKLDAEGKFIYPGFIDAHTHFVSLRAWLTNCQSCRHQKAGKISLKK